MAGQEKTEQEAIGLRPSWYLGIFLVGLVPIDQTFLLLYGALSGNWSGAFSSILTSLLIFGPALLVLAYWLSSDLRRLEQSHLPNGKSVGSIFYKLHTRITFWAFVLTFAYQLINISRGEYLVEDIESSTAAEGKLIVAALWFSLIYACQFSVYAYFITMESSIYGRGWLARRTNLPVERASVYHSLLIRLLIGTMAIVLLPAILIISDLYYFEDIRGLQGLTLREAVLLDISSTIIASFFCIYFICRSLTQPLQNLKEVVEEVQADNLTAKAVPLTDDELGILSVQVNTMIAQIRDRNFIRQTFGRYVPEKVAELILENRDRFTPQVRTATLMFIDIEGFTSLCETYEPKTVAEILNVYFGEVVKIVARNDGVVNHFEGDAMLVTFNVPVVDLEHAQKAVRTAAQIQELLKDYEFPHGKRLACRIGISTGEVIAGVVGPPERAIYTVYGDAVNTASRLEKMNKELASRILMTEATESLLKRDGIADLDVVSRGPQPIRGKADPVVIYEVRTAL